MVTTIDRHDVRSASASVEYSPKNYIFPSSGKMRSEQTTAIVVMIVPIYSIYYPLSISEAQYQGQTLNGPENVNLKCSEKAEH